MDSRLVMGVAAYFLLMSAVAFSVEAQLSGTLLVDVVADDEVQVFWSIFGGNNTGVSISYTIFYATNLEDPTTFNSTLPGAMPVNATIGTYDIILPSTFDPSTNVTVVVRAVGDNGATLESLPPVTKQTFEDIADIGAPMNVSVQRFDDNKMLEITWLPIDSMRIISYDVEYRIFKTTGSTGFPSTIINSRNTDPKLTIDGLDGVTNYGVRVRGVIEAPRVKAAAVTIPTVNGPWSALVVSQVRSDPQPITSSGAATIKATHFMLMATIFLYFC